MKKPNQSRTGLSRRRFCNSMASGAAEAAILTVPGAAAEQVGEVHAVKAILNINGRVHSLSLEPRWTLQYVLRDRLGLMGTKSACERGECGACTVLVDDVPRYSCSVLTHTVRSKQVVTIEGLAAADGTLHPVQRGVIEEQGFQCAFCMSGFIMSAVGYLKKHPNPTREDLAHGVSGNLCRCQDYDKILTALERGATLSREVARG